MGRIGEYNLKDKERWFNLPKTRETIEKWLSKKEWLEREGFPAKSHNQLPLTGLDEGEQRVEGGRES